MIIVLASLLALMACLMQVTQTPASIFVACLVATFCGLYLLWLTIFGKQGVRFCWILALGLLNGYCGGILNTQISYGVHGFDALPIMDLRADFAAYALFLVLTSSAVLLLAGLWESDVLRGVDLLEPSVTLERFLWVFAVWGIFAIAHGELTFQGLDTTKSTKVSIVGFVAETSAPYLLSLAFSGFLNARDSRRWRFLALSIMALCITFPLGRRAQGYALLLTILACFRLTRLGQAIKPAKALLIIAGAAVLMAVSTVGFSAVRLLVSSDAHYSERANLLTLLPSALDRFASNPEEMTNYLRNNVQDRTFVISYLAELAHGGRSAEPMWGKDFLFSFELVVPDAVYRLVGASKEPLRVIGAEENLANEHFGVPNTDMSNSVLTAGFIDFGLLGVVLYPLLLCVLFRSVCAFSGHVIQGQGTVMLILVTISNLLLTEAELIEYFSTLRWLLILICVWKALEKLPHFRWTPAATKMLKPERDEPQLSA